MRRGPFGRLDAFGRAILSGRVGAATCSPNEHSLSAWTMADDLMALHTGTRSPERTLTGRPMVGVTLMPINSGTRMGVVRGMGGRIV